MQQLTPEIVAAILAGVLSLVFTLVPGLNSKFATLSDDVKRAIMGGMSALIAIVVYLIACTGTLSAGFPIACPTGGFWELVMIIFLSVTVNQGVFSATPRPNAIKAAKLQAAK